MSVALWSKTRKTYDQGMKCPACGEPSGWHILIGKDQPVPMMDWHNVTEGRLRPSDLFPEDMGIAPETMIVIPYQRS